MRVACVLITHLRAKVELRQLPQLHDRPEATPAVLYARVSSDRQDVDLSVCAQLRAFRHYAKGNGYVVTREYVDAFKSMLRRRGYRVTSITEHSHYSATGKLMEATVENDHVTGGRGCRS